MNKESAKEESFNILVAKCGRPIGLRGALKLILYTDFSDFFCKSCRLKCGDEILSVLSFNKNRNVIQFNEILDVDSAKKLNSMMLYATEESTKNTCNLQDGEYFWFDIIGCNVVDNGVILGKIVDINRIGRVDYLVVNVDSNIRSRFNPKVKQFIIPYIDKYILDVKISQKLINTMHAIHLLEAS